MSRAILLVAAQEAVNRLPTPASSPWCAVPGKRWSIAWRISWSPPLHGRERAGGRHRQAGEHERLGQRDQELVVVDPVLAVQDRGRRRAREGDRDAVDRLAALARGQPPVGDRGQVGDRRRRCPSGASRGRCAHVVEVDHDRDRHLHAEGALRPCSSSDDTGEAMPSWARLVATATIGSPASAAACLATSSVRPPPIPTTASKKPARRRPRSSVAASTRAALDHPDLGVGELRAQHLGDLLALPGPDRDRHVAAARDPAVGEQRRQPRDGAGPDVDRQRRPDHAGQQRHATSRARVQVAWSSTSTHSTPPIGATPTRPPRSANSWKPSS